MTKNDKNTNLNDLKEIAKKFRDDRNWQQYHTPKELAINMSIETGELLELFVFKSDEEISNKFNTDKAFKQNVLDELADVVHSCLAFANSLDIDIAATVIEKIDKTAKKYPVEKVKGQNKKYTEF